MEHRCGSRGIVSYPVTLLTVERHHIYGVLQNLGAGGAFVGGLTRPMCRHQLVDVLLHKPGAGLADNWEWPAMVLRCADDSVALMFDRMHFAELHPVLAALRGSADLRAPQALDHSPAAVRGSRHARRQPSSSRFSSI
jgi:hypothetical protein